MDNMQSDNDKQGYGEVATADGGWVWTVGGDRYYALVDDHVYQFQYM
jgi:hypothetical protein